MTWLNKSYTPLRPKPTRKPPSWVSQGKTRMVLSTDDTEFGVCTVSPDTGKLRRIAYQNGRGQWCEVTVEWKRVKESA